MSYFISKKSTKRHTGAICPEIAPSLRFASRRSLRDYLYIKISNIFKFFYTNTNFVTIYEYYRQF